jgi:hypothetical protein
MYAIQEEGVAMIHIGAWKSYIGFKLNFTNKTHCFMTTMKLREVHKVHFNHFSI